MLLEDLRQIIASLADPVRLRLLHLLFARQGRDWAVNEIVRALDLPQPTVSRHLARLRDDGLVDVRQVGRSRLYRLADSQAPAERAMLAALEPFVAQTPDAQQDLERADRDQKRGEQKRLTTVPQSATKWLLKGSDEAKPLTDETHIGALFKALARRKRRVLLAGIQRNPGATLAEVSAWVDGSRQAVRKQLDVLERAELVHVVEDGRSRRLYYNPIPLQLVYEHWTDQRSSVLGSAMIEVKRRVEQKRREQGEEDG